MLDLFAVFDRDRMAARLKALAQAQIFIGTSSWKYEGWLGMLYDRANYENRSRFSKTLNLPQSTFSLMPSRRHCLSLASPSETEAF